MSDFPNFPDLTPEESERYWGMMREIKRKQDGLHITEDGRVEMEFLTREEQQLPTMPEQIHLMCQADLKKVLSAIFSVDEDGNKVCAWDDYVKKKVYIPAECVPPPDLNIPLPDHVVVDVSTPEGRYHANVRALKYLEASEKDPDRAQRLKEQIAQYEAERDS